jgi:hypothetical protein
MFRNSSRVDLPLPSMPSQVMNFPRKFFRFLFGFFSLDGDSRNRVFENQKVLIAHVQQNGKLVETLDSARQGRSV